MALKGISHPLIRVSFISILLASLAFLWLFVILLLLLLFFKLLERSPSSQELFVISIFGMGLFAVPVFFVIYWVVRRFEQRPLASLGLHLDRSSIWEFLGGMVLASIPVSASFLSLYWEGALSISWDLPSVLNLWLIVIGALGWLGTAFWEELYFRGYLLQTLASSVGIVPAVFFSSIIFATVHAATYKMQLWFLLDILIVGLILALLYLKTKSLWAPLGMHFANNFLIAHILPIPVYDYMQFPIKANGQPVQLKAPHLIFHTELVQKENLMRYEWEALLFSLIIIALVLLLVWRLPWFRPHPEMEALWQRYVPIAQPWAQLKAWWAKRKEATQPPPEH